LASSPCTVCHVLADSVRIDGDLRLVKTQVGEEACGLVVRALEAVRIHVPYGATITGHAASSLDIMADALSVCNVSSDGALKMTAGHELSVIAHPDAGAAPTYAVAADHAPCITRGAGHVYMAGGGVRLGPMSRVAAGTVLDIQTAGAFYLGRAASVNSRQIYISVGGQAELEESSVEAAAGSLSARSLRMHNASIRAGEGLEVSVDEDVDLAGGSSIAGAGLVHISAGAGINMSSSSIAARRARISAGGDVVLSSSAIAAAEINVTAVGRVRLREDDEITGSMMVVVEGQAIEVSGGRVWSQAIRLRAGEAVRLVSAEVDASSNVSVAAGSIELAGSWCGCRAAGCLVEMAGVDDVVLRSAARVEASDVVLHAFDIAIHSDCAEGPLLPACASSVSASGRGWRASNGPGRGAGILPPCRCLPPLESRIAAPARWPCLLASCCLITMSRLAAHPAQPLKRAPQR